MATLLLVNPKAGDGSRDLELWRSCLAAAGVRPDRTAAVGDLHDAADLSGVERLLLAGGDGTLSRVVPACVEAGCVLGVLPSGTANDFAAALGIPDDPPGACDVVAAGRVGRVDLGRIGGHLFLNVAHVGAGADVSTGVDGAEKRRWRRLSYARRALDLVSRVRGFHARMECDGQVADGRWLEVLVANGTRFGGMQQVFGASIEDGALDLFCVRPSPLPLLVLTWLRSHLLGQVPDGQEHVVQMRGSRVDVRTRRPRRLVADGEPVGRTPARLEVEAGALRVLRPDTGTE